MTMPRDIGDVRFAHFQLRGFGPFGNKEPGSIWYDITTDKRVLHWFAENRDKTDPKVSTLPTGFTSSQFDANWVYVLILIYCLYCSYDFDYIDYIDYIHYID